MGIEAFTLMGVEVTGSSFTPTLLKGALGLGLTVAQPVACGNGISSTARLFLARLPQIDHLSHG
jgi:hypothetical protein